MTNAEVVAKRQKNLKSKYGIDAGSLDSTRSNIDLDHAFSALSDAVVITDANLKDPGPRILYVNPAFEMMTGYSSRDVIGRNPRFLQGPRSDRIVLDSIRDSLHAGRSINTQVVNYSSEGHAYWTELSIEPMFSATGKVERFIAVQRNITDRKREEDAIRFRANHDVLTGLANRAQFLERLDQALAEATRYGHRLGVAMMDLDRFKPINDTLGHAVGDAVLKQVAERLMRLVRESDLVARIGGDEFAFLIIEPHDKFEAVTAMQRLVNAVGKPIEHQEHKLEVTASIGVSVFPDDAHDAANLLHHADLAMYTAKSRGRNNVRLFSGAISSEVDRRTDLERRLRAAIHDGNLRLNFQPIHDAQTGELESLEALCRWTDGRFGQVSPADFIPMAERLGVIDALGTWVLWEACRQGVALQRPGRAITIAVNVAPSQFNQPDLISHVQRALHASGLPADCLRLEITEQTMLVDLETCVEHITQLRALGVEVAVDDFGVGYSNLSQLLNLPIDQVKLDRSLLQDVESNPKTQALVKGIIHLAHDLGFRVVCEGVETREASQELISLGCDLLQGFLFAKPMLAPDALKYSAKPAVVFN